MSFCSSQCLLKKHASPDISLSPSHTHIYSFCQLFGQVDKGKYSKGSKHAQLRERRECVVNLIDSFEHEGPHGKHVCMVFEALGENLLSLIKRYNYAGIPINKVKDIAKKVAEGEYICVLFFALFLFL